MANPFHLNSMFDRRQSSVRQLTLFEGEAVGVGQPEGQAPTADASLLNQRYIQQKLEHGLSRIWSDIQQKVKVYLLSTDLSCFKYDEFIQVLDIVNR